MTYPEGMISACRYEIEKCKYLSTFVYTDMMIFHPCQFHYLLKSPEIGVDYGVGWEEEDVCIAVFENFNWQT